MKQKSKKPRWRRTMAAVVGLPLTVIVLVGLVLSYRIYASNRTMDLTNGLPRVSSPRPPQSLLIFAPHCDDETLGAAGLMYQATHSGCDVHVVVLTNGDGFRISASRAFDKINVNDADFIRYGYLRQTETRAAVKLLGVQPDHVTFLGYPDRGLMPMWTTNWSRKNAFRSYYTRANYSPYTDSPTPNAPYCGEALLADVIRQLEQDKPTDVYVTHPSDDHPDHAAASVFVRTGLDWLRARGETWALQARLHYYLVHRGDWPVPQGLHEDCTLPPPSHMMFGDTRWQELRLTHYQVMRKYAAIKRYRTQTNIEGRFLFSFARRGELFGDVDTGTSASLVTVPDGAIRMNDTSPQPSPWKGEGDNATDLAAWNGIAPMTIDPIGDDVGRVVTGGADIARIYAARDSHSLYVRLDTHRMINKEVTYSISLRPLRVAATEPPFLQYTVKPGVIGVVASASDDGVQYVWRGDMMVFQIPLSCLHITDADRAATVDIAADTKFAGMFVDHTGFHGVAYNPEFVKALVAQQTVMPDGRS